MLLAGTESGLYAIAGEGVPAASPQPLTVSGVEVDPLARDAQAPHLLYAAAGKEGLWHSPDGGTSWTHRWRPPSGYSLYTIRAHPTRPGVLYAGLEPVAVWISEDHGRTWRELIGLQAVPDKAVWQFFPPRQPHVRALYVPPHAPDSLYVGIEEGGVYVSDDGGQTFQSRNEGIYRDIHQVQTFPGETTLLLATTGDGFYRSSNGGAQWEQITTGLTRSYTVPLWIEPSSPHTMLLAAAQAPPPSWYRGGKGADAKLFCSRDRGVTWQESMEGWPSPQKGMIYCFAADPQDPALLFAGTTDGKVYASADLGRRWRLLAEGLPEVYSILPVA